MFTNITLHCLVLQWRCYEQDQYVFIGDVINQLHSIHLENDACLKLITETLSEKRILRAGWLFISENV